MREAKRDLISRESHYFLDKRYLLKVIEHNAPPKVIKRHETIELHIRPKTTKKKRQEILNEWYRAQLKEIVPKCVPKTPKKNTKECPQMCPRMRKNTEKKVSQKASQKVSQKASQNVSF